MRTTEHNGRHAETHHAENRSTQEDAEGTDDYDVNKIDMDKLNALINNAAEATKTCQETTYMEEPAHGHHLL